MELNNLVNVVGIKSVQTGWLFNPTLLTSTGEDESYFDVTIGAVDVSKAVPAFDGGVGVLYSSGSYAVADHPMIKAIALGTAPTVAASFNATCRLINSTTLRISATKKVGSGITSVTMQGRWTVVEGK